MLLALLSAGSQSLPLLPTSKLGPSGADSQVGGSLQWILLWGWEFLMPWQPPQVFIARSFEALFPQARTLGCEVCLYSPVVLPECHTQMWDLPVHKLPPCSVEFTSHFFACSVLQPCSPCSPACLALHPSYQSQWMFLLQLLGCRTSIQFNFCQFWLFFVFKFVVLLLVVWGGFHSWLEVPKCLFAQGFHF